MGCPGLVSKGGPHARRTTSLITHRQPHGGQIKAGDVVTASPSPPPIKLLKNPTDVKCRTTEICQSIYSVGTTCRKPLHTLILVSTPVWKKMHLNTRTHSPKGCFTKTLPCSCWKYSQNPVVTTYFFTHHSYLLMAPISILVP